jgi:hypothetical protein
MAFHMREQEKVAWRKVGWTGRMRDKRHVAPPPLQQKTVIFWEGGITWRVSPRQCSCRVGRGIVVVKEPITAAPHTYTLYYICTKYIILH